MKDICRICQKRAIGICICNKNLLFCFEHMVEHLDTPKGQHKPISLKMLKFVEKCKFNLEKINQVKSEIIRRSNYMIKAILAITDFQLSTILNNYDQIKNILKNKNSSDEIIQMIEDYGNIEIKETELDEFSEIAKNYLSVLINENEFCYQL